MPTSITDHERGPDRAVDFMWVSIGAACEAWADATEFGAREASSDLIASRIPAAWDIATNGRRFRLWYDDFRDALDLWAKAHWAHPDPFQLRAARAIANEQWGELVCDVRTVSSVVFYLLMQDE